MKTIFINISSQLPIPATKGGAIETLMTMLIEQNEIEKRVHFVLPSVPDQEAEIIAQKYQYTRIIFSRKEEKPWLYSIFWRVNKIFHKKEIINHYEFKNYLLAKKNHADLMVVQDFACWPYQYLARKFGHDQLWVHLHAELVPDQPMIDAFKKAIAISEFVKRRWLEPCSDGEHECKVVFNCVDEKKFDKRKAVSGQELNVLRKSLGFTEKDIVLLYVGRIAPVKGVKELLQAVRKTDNVKLLLIGRMKEYDMDYVHEIETMVDEMLDKVKALGYVPNDELYRYYQMADIQVVPSMWEEAAGLVCIEGMYAGLPLIVTDSGGLVEYVTAECALTAKRSDVVNELRNKIEQLRDNAELRKKMGAVSSERAKRFTQKRYYDDFLEALNINE